MNEYAKAWKSDIDRGLKMTLIGLERRVKRVLDKPNTADYIMLAAQCEELAKTLNTRATLQAVIGYESKG